MKTFPSQTQIFKVLAHPTRLAILEILHGGEQCVCHMESVLGLRQAHISQHLMVLRDAGLVTDRRDGWNIFYRVIKPEIYAIIDAANTITGASKEAQGKSRTNSKKSQCPCPKCNPTVAGVIHELPLPQAIQEQQQRQDNRR